MCVWVWVWVKVHVHMSVCTIVSLDNFRAPGNKADLSECRPSQCGFTLSSPVSGLEWPRGFQEDEVPRFHDNGTGWW